MANRYRTRTVVPWVEAVRTLCENESAEAPIPVQVVEAASTEAHVKSGDDLFLHEFIMEEVALSRSATDSKDEKYDWVTPADLWRSQYVDADRWTTLPIRCKERFILHPRYQMSHTFHSAKEILDTLPAVSSLIYPTIGFSVNGQSVQELERLKIIDRIQDTRNGTEVLSVRSMKTEEQHYLSPDLKVPFLQLSSECFKCSESGLSIADIVTGWKPRDPLFRVNICSGPMNNLCPNTVGKHCDKRSVPAAWRNETLYLKPVLKIRVTNASLDAKDFYMTDTARLTVKLESTESNLAFEVDSRSLTTFVGSLSELRLLKQITSNEPLLFMVTGGSLSTYLRQHPTITVGNRIAIHQTKKPVKFLMQCTSGQNFLVDMSYAGSFKRLLPDNGNSSELVLEQLLNEDMPCTVEVVKGDDSLGYDQLKRRPKLTVKDIVTETTLIVSLFTANGNVISERPFEIPLTRSNLTVRVLDRNAYNFRMKNSYGDVKSLPVVELINEKNVTSIKKRSSEKQANEDGYEAMSPTVPPTAPVSSPPHRPPKPDRYKPDLVPANSQSKELPMFDYGNEKSPINQRHGLEGQKMNERPPSSTFDYSSALPPKDNQTTSRKSVLELKENLTSFQTREVEKQPCLVQSRQEMNERLSPKKDTKDDPDVPPRKMANFEQMHYWYAPSRHGAAQSHTKDQKSRNQNAAVSPEVLKHSHVGVYNEQLPGDAQGRLAAILKANRRQANSANMNNPIYEVMLEVKSVGDTKISPQEEEPAYAFAKDVPIRKEKLSSITDDRGNYENLSKQVNENDSDDYEDYSRETMAEFFER